MKKIILLVFAMISIALKACVGSTGEQTTTTMQQTTTTMEQTTTTMTEDTFIPVYTSMVQCDLAIFNVAIDHAEINGTTNVITVTVEMIAKMEINQELYTSSYGEIGIVEIRIVSVEEEEVALYSEFYDIPFTSDVLNVHLTIDDSLTRVIQFARTPFHESPGGELPSPTGMYKVQVALYSIEKIWIDTRITIRVID
jgi:hypothetical protein